MICKVTSCYKTGLSREIGERRGRGGYQREKTLWRGMDIFCDNNTMHVIYLDRIG